MLDTNTVSYIARGRSRAARTTLLGLQPHETACISAVTEAEVRYGLAKRPQATALKVLMESLLSSIRVLSWGREEAGIYGLLRASLESGGQMLGSMDMMIAAHAIAADAVLVTNDRAFDRVNRMRPSVNWATDL